MSTLHRTLDDYLRVRRALGFVLELEGRLLPEFVSFLERHGSSCITTALAIRWAIAPPEASPSWSNARMGMVRGFAKYLCAFDPRTEVPPRELLPVPCGTRPTPYIYTDKEIGSLISAAHTLLGFKGVTYATLIGLLAATGMRDRPRSSSPWHRFCCAACCGYRSVWRCWSSSRRI